MTKTELYANLSEVREELSRGVRTSANYTAAHAINDWLETLADRDSFSYPDGRSSLRRATRLYVH